MRHLPYFHLRFLIGGLVVWFCLVWAGYKLGVPALVFDVIVAMVCAGMAVALGKSYRQRDPLFNTGHVLMILAICGIGAAGFTSDQVGVYASCALIVGILMQYISLDRSTRRLLQRSHAASSTPPSQ